MKGFQKIFAAGFTLVTVFFIACAFSLIAFAAIELWHGVNPGAQLALRDRFNSILESIGLLTIAVAALELGQTILDEEVRREAEMSVPTRVRRFLSRFLIVIIVSLSIEFLVAVFQLIHDNPAELPQVSWIGIATAALLAAWGVFIKFNRVAEELEPEAIKRVQREDKQT
ncbi:MAG TPA: hypothetical protein VE262_18790 [Blastocatellia bacterium]|nr:hypothetical protein [Blastocatellia bacterium]